MMAKSSLVRCDALACIMSILCAGPKILSWEGQAAFPTFLHHVCIMLSSVVIPGWILWSIKKDWQGFVNNRLRVAIVGKLLMAAGHAIAVYSEDPFKVWVSDGLFHVVVRMFGRSTMVPMVCLALGNPLPFWWHVAVQGMMSIMGLVWVPNLTSVCSVDEGIKAAVSRLGQLTERVLVGLSPPGFTDDIVAYASEVPCARVAVFYTILMEFLLTTYVLYMVECNLRVNFLSERLEDDEKPEYRHLKLALMTLATTALIFCCQFVWFT